MFTYKIFNNIAEEGLSILKDNRFLMASENHQFIASRLVKEIAALGGDISTFVSSQVADRVTERYQKALSARR